MRGLLDDLRQQQAAGEARQRAAGAAPAAAGLSGGLARWPQPQPGRGGAPEQGGRARRRQGEPQAGEEELRGGRRARGGGGLLSWLLRGGRRAQGGSDARPEPRRDDSVEGAAAAGGGVRREDVHLLFVVQLPRCRALRWFALQVRGGWLFFRAVDPSGGQRLAARPTRGAIGRETGP